MAEKLYRVDLGFSKMTFTRPGIQDFLNKLANGPYPKVVRVSQNEADLTSATLEGSEEEIDRAIKNIVGTKFDYKDDEDKPKTGVIKLLGEKHEVKAKEAEAEKSAEPPKADPSPAPTAAKPADSSEKKISKEPRRAQTSVSNDRMKVSCERYNNGGHTISVSAAKGKIIFKSPVKATVTHIHPSKKSESIIESGKTLAMKPNKDGSCVIIYDPGQNAGFTATIINQGEQHPLHF